MITRRCTRCRDRGACGQGCLLCGYTPPPPRPPTRQERDVEDARLVREVEAETERIPPTWGRR